MTPRSGFVWVRGHYGWSSNAYEWIAGHYEPETRVYTDRVYIARPSGEEEHHWWRRWHREHEEHEHDYRY